MVIARTLDEPFVHRDVESVMDAAFPNRFMQRWSK